MNANKPSHAPVDALTKTDTQTARQPTDNAKAAAAWIGVSPERRGETLRDLLLLVDHLPQTGISQKARFPRIASRTV